MEVHQVLEIKLISAFDLVVVSKIEERVKELHEDSISWKKFVEHLKDKYFEEDLERMMKKLFLE